MRIDALTRLRLLLCGVNWHSPLIETQPSIPIRAVEKKLVRRGEPLNAMSTTLPLFWHLSSVSKKERIDASIKLVGALEQFQTQFSQKPAPGTSGSDDEDEDEESTSKSDGLDLLNAQDVSYSIRRLIRGLASSREQSRLGFAVALTEVRICISLTVCAFLYIFELCIASVSYRHCYLLSNKQFNH